MKFEKMNEPDNVFIILPLVTYEWGNGVRCITIGWLNLIISFEW